ncbi:MAG: hypothetical protein RXR06_09585 [Thermoproteus sp.]
MEPKLKDGFDLLVITSDPFDLLARMHGEELTVMEMPIEPEEARSLARSAKESGMLVAVQLPKDHPCREILGLADAEELPKDLQSYRIFIVAASHSCRFYALAALGP